MLEGVKNASPWALQQDQVLRNHSIDPNIGLRTAEAKERLTKFGPNLLHAERGISWFTRLLAQFKSPVVITLVVATFVTALLGETVDSIAILSIVVLNAVIGYFQESKAEAAVQALKNLSAPKTRVFRDGNTLEISAADVVCGDILIFESGDYVAADARIILARQLSVDEAILTGESLPVAKTNEPIRAEALLAERSNMLFAGTAIATGSGRAVVTAIGMATEIGRIATMLEASSVAETPLQLRLKQVSTKLLYFCVGVVVLVAGLGIVRGQNWSEVFITSISLAVAAIPEGLPTVVTLALALAIRRMVKRNAIVRHLPSVETLGSTDVICTDKTGTLTTGKMRTREVFLLQAGMLNTATTGLKGNIDFDNLVEAAVLCSNASLQGDDQANGDPTEIALLYLAKEQGFDFHHWNETSPRLYEWSFDSNRKRMSVAVRTGTQVTLHVKGAPESLLPRCGLSSSEREMIDQALEKLSSQGRRLLAIATKTLKISSAEFQPQNFPNPDAVEEDLQFLGLISIADPPRPETIPAIAACKKAGIQVVMITGDHPATAKAIAKELGILEEGKFDQVLTGSELEHLDLAELTKQVEKIAVYARVTPEHKIKIVKAWKKLGKIVAMTGDGVNDAPALKEASIGIAMGKGGTEVARQASSIILTDDHFATIVHAVEEGRAIYGNIRRTVEYLLSGNLAEILIMLGAAVLGWPTPLFPVHLLWINLVTDGFPSLALASEPVPKNALEGMSRPSPQNFFDRVLYRNVTWVGVLMAVMALVVYGYSLKTGGEVTARTHVFSFLVFGELFRALACRSSTKTFFQMGVNSNLYLLVAVAIPAGFQMLLHHTDLFQQVFKVHMISWGECVGMIALTLIPVSILEIRKHWRQWRQGQQAQGKKVYQV